MLTGLSWRAKSSSLSYFSSLLSLSLPSPPASSSLWTRRARHPRNLWPWLLASRCLFSCFFVASSVNFQTLLDQSSHRPVLKQSQSKEWTKKRKRCMTFWLFTDFVDIEHVVFGFVCVYNFLKRKVLLHWFCKFATTRKCFCTSHVYIWTFLLKNGWMGWKSLGGAFYRAPLCGANNLREVAPSAVLDEGGFREKVG